MRENKSFSISKPGVELIICKNEAHRLAPVSLFSSCIHTYKSRIPARPLPRDA